MGERGKLIFLFGGIVRGFVGAARDSGISVIPRFVFFCGNVARIVELFSRCVV